MRKLILIGITVGIANLALANSVSLPTGSSISGNNAYLYKVTAADLGLTSGESISDVSLNFNSILLTTYGQNTFHADLINAGYSSHTYSDSDNSSDYFTTSSFTGSHPASLDPIGERTDLTHGVSKTWSWDNTDITGYSTFLTDLNYDLANYGAFDIGIDPDCNYNVGSITFTYTVSTPVSVPDTATTAGLLGMSFLGLLVFRRKLALN